MNPQPVPVTGSPGQTLFVAGHQFAMHGENNAAGVDISVIPLAV
jgi:hypothetical protein